MLKDFGKHSREPSDRVIARSLADVEKAGRPVIYYSQHATPTRWNSPNSRLKILLEQQDLEVNSITTELKDVMLLTPRILLRRLDFLVSASPC